MLYEVITRPCKKQLCPPTNAQVSEVSNEDNDLLDRDPQPPRRGRTSLPCYLLVAETAGGVLGMATKHGIVDVPHAIQPRADIGRTREPVCRAFDLMERA